MQMQVMFFINESDVYFTISSILNSHLSTHPKGMACAEQSIGLVGDSQEEGIRGSLMGGQCWEKTSHQILHEPWCKLITQVSSGASGMLSICLFFLRAFFTASSFLLAVEMFIIVSRH